MLKKELGNKYNSINIFIETFYNGAWFQNEKSTDTTSRKSDKKESVDLSHMPSLQGDEVKEGKVLKILTPNKRLILLVQIKAGSNSYKLKNKIRQILYLFYQHNKITKKNYSNLIKPL